MVSKCKNLFSELVQLASAISCYYTLNEVVLYIKVRNHPLN